MGQSWTGLFREHPLPQLPVNKIAQYLTDGFGKSTKKLYMALGVGILRKSLDPTDDETICQLALSGQ